MLEIVEPLTVILPFNFGTNEYNIYNGLCDRGLELKYHEIAMIKCIDDQCELLLLVLV